MFCRTGAGPLCGGSESLSLSGSGVSHDPPASFSSGRRSNGQTAPLDLPEPRLPQAAAGAGPDAPLYEEEGTGNVMIYSDTQLFCCNLDDSTFTVNCFLYCNLL